MRSDPVTVPPEATVATAAGVLAEHRIGCLPVTRRDVLVGVVTETDVLDVLAGASRYGRLSGSCNPPVRDRMTTSLATAGASTTLAEATQLLRNGAIRHLPITEGDNRLVGLVSDRDLRRAVGRGLAPSTCLAELGGGRPSTASRDEPMSRAAYRMAHDRIGAQPVIDAQGRLVGILTVTDVLAHCARVLE